MVEWPFLDWLFTSLITSLFCCGVRWFGAHPMPNTVHLQQLICRRVQLVSGCCWSNLWRFLLDERHSC
jgi:hypothetical protein